MCARIRCETASSPKQFESARAAAAAGSEHQTQQANVSSVSSEKAAYSGTPNRIADGGRAVGGGACDRAEGGRLALSCLRTSKLPTIGFLGARPRRGYTAPMKVEEIAEAIPPDQLARFRRWFTAFEAGRTNHAEELDSAATKLGRLAGRAFAELKRRAKEP